MRALKSTSNMANMHHLALIYLFKNNRSSTSIDKKLPIFSASANIMVPTEIMSTFTWNQVNMRIFSHENGWRMVSVHFSHFYFKNQAINNLYITQEVLPITSWLAFESLQLKSTLYLGKHSKWHVGVSKIRPGGQNQSGKDWNLAHWFWNIKIIK